MRQNVQALIRCRAEGAVSDQILLFLCPFISRVFPEDVTYVDCNLPDDVNYAYPGGLPLRISTHDPSDVAIYARGPMAHLFYGVQEQSTTAHVMAYAACVGRFKDKCTRSDAFYASTSAQTKAALWMVVPLIMTYFVLE